MLTLEQFTEHGAQGGRTRAANLSPARRSAIARKASRARWGKKLGRWPLVKGRQDWNTPTTLFESLDAEFNFTLDAAASVENALCPRFFDEQTDGLAQDWAPRTTWCNPPYDPKGLGRWVEKAYQESQRGAVVVMLIPARTDVRWWHAYAMKGEIRFLPGRVRFVLPSGRSSSSPFPSAIVIFRPASMTSDAAAMTRSGLR